MSGTGCCATRQGAVLLSAVTCCDMQCSAVTCSAVHCCAVLCCAVLCCAVSTFPRDATFTSTFPLLAVTFLPPGSVTLFTGLCTRLRSRIASRVFYAAAPRTLAAVTFPPPRSDTLFTSLCTRLLSRITLRTLSVTLAKKRYMSPKQVDLLKKKS